MKHIFTLLALLLLTTCAALCQVDLSISATYEIIKIDSTSFRTDKRIPFDRQFIVELDVTEDLEVKNIYLYDTKIIKLKNGERVRTLKSSNGVATPRQTLSYKVSKNKLQIGVEPIPPNRNFDIEIVRKLSGRELATAIKIFFLLENKDTQAAKDLFEATFSATIIEPPLPGITSKRYFKAKFNDFEDMFSKNVKPNIQAAQQQVNLDKISRNITSLPFKKILEKLAAMKRDSASIAKLYAGKESDILKKYLNGNISLSPTNHSNAQDYEFKKRLAGISINITEIKKLIILSNLLLASDVNDDDFKKFNQLLTEMALELENSQIKLKKSSDEITKLVQSDDKLTYGRLLVLSSKMETIKTSTTFNFVPEVGACVAAPYGRNGLKYIPRLYFGVNIYPRPIDKNIAFADVPNFAKFWYRTSISIGVTATKLKQPDLDEFFNNTSLLIGLNFRLLRGLRFSAGPMLYRQKFTNPILSDHRLCVAPFAGFSLDVDIASAFEKLTGKLF